MKWPNPFFEKPAMFSKDMDSVLHIHLAEPGVHEDWTWKPRKECLGARGRGVGQICFFAVRNMFGGQARQKGVWGRRRSNVTG